MATDGGAYFRSLGTTVGDIVEGRDLVTLSLTDKVCDAVGVLHKNSIQAAPVMDAEGKCIGCVDMLEVLDKALSLVPNTMNLTVADLSPLQENMTALREDTVLSVLQMTKASYFTEPMVPVDLKDSLVRVRMTILDLVVLMLTLVPPNDVFM